MLAVNADGNMPYDICEDEQTLDYIESEMAKRGITQELIDETRALTENQMLDDMKYLVSSGYDINYKDENGATPVRFLLKSWFVLTVFTELSAPYCSSQRILECGRVLAR